MAAADKAGKAALKQLLATLDTIASGKHPAEIKEKHEG
jgi:hypothetical protein